MSTPMAPALARLADLADYVDPVGADDEGWQAWLQQLFPTYVSAGFGEHHVQFWDWAWTIELGKSADVDEVAIWGRGGAKSTSSELAVVAWGARNRRRYVLYVCETQEQADDHVSNIASLLEADAFGARYPLMSKRLVGKFGNSKGWRRNRLRTATGFTVDALGLDTASRGVKLEDQRPDAMVFDDLDSQSDTPAITEKKIAALTKAVLPAGSSDVAVLAIQNLVHEHSIFAQLADGRARFLARRHVSGPIPAVRGLVTEQRTGDDGFGRDVIIAGTPTWEGQSLEICQRQIDKYGLAAFKSEAQHDVTAPPGGMFDHVVFAHCSPDAVPWRHLVRSVVWLDPAVTNTDKSDSMGIQADAVSEAGVLYRLRSWEGRTSPLDALKRAIVIAHEIGAEHVGVETDQGGDTWEVVYDVAVDRVNADRHDLELAPLPRLPFVAEKAGAGFGPKAHRASQMLVDYESAGHIIHVINDTADHELLEKALRRFPKSKPFDLVDAAFWSWWDLIGMHEEEYLVEDDDEERVTIGPSY